jgi:hypothetical protein
MAKRTTLGEAIQIWRAHAPGPHPTLDDLYTAAARGGLEAMPALLEHVARCGRCARELQALVECVAEAESFDLALPRAAASALGAPVVLATECGRYAIGFYPRGEDDALVTIEVKAPDAAALEGAVVTVRDGGGMVVLSAPIVLGRASGRVGNRARLDLSRLVVQAEPRA